MNKRIIGAIALVLVWALLAGFAWFGPADDFSLSERRPLDQLPDLNGKTLWSGKFMGSFEDYTLDQFPMRDTFRTVKALFHSYVLQQQDNNGIYMADGHVAELAFPLDEESVKHGLQSFQENYDKYLQNAGNIYVTVVPDKGYYLAEANNYPVLDYQHMFTMVQEGLPWAEYIDITDCLTLEDYYKTDTHWRQEKLQPVADRLGSVMGFDPSASYTETVLERPFYGVYYGQAALPMAPDTMVLLENDILAGCTVTIYDKKGNPVTYSGVYDHSFYDSPDMYQIYLSGAQSIVHIENPNAKTDKELVVFRDSYGSALAPLLVQDYAKVTLVDIRYFNKMQNLSFFVEFEGRDVLFMYSSLVLNKNLI